MLELSERDCYPRFYRPMSDDSIHLRRGIRHQCCARSRLTCLTENFPMRRLARSVGLTATTLAAEAASELVLRMPQISDEVRNA